MPTLTHRATFALDGKTAHRLQHLASLWRVSQAEVVRRAVAQAESAATSARPDPIAMLKALHDSGQGLKPKVAEAYLAEVCEDRKRWRGR